MWLQMRREREVGALSGGYRRSVDFILRIMGSPGELKQKDGAMGCAYPKDHRWTVVWVKGKRGYKELKGHWMTMVAGIGRRRWQWIWRRGGRSKRWFSSELFRI